MASCELVQSCNNVKLSEDDTPGSVELDFDISVVTIAS